MAGTDPRIAEETFAERERLAGLFADLGAPQWAADSLCDGWRVREVLAHMTMPFRLSGLGFLGGMLRSGFRFNRFADRDARAATARLGDRDLAELYGANVRHPWQPPGGGQAGALSHEVIHGLDITEPLGLEGPPPERIGLVLASAGGRNLAFFGVDLAGKRLEATDVDAAIGDGRTHRMTARRLLLVVTGRVPLDASTGEDS
ncbi:MAG TPA: maleylpyruvate isomerase family mycothiol-dependent enzyme [Stackebrandtia sp.]|jgi:uncharacterized protein (TIGR03083 family)|uniref:maleylpyruvate isomerase family mycothiol-dependent enzyme n=1 Tax=Stackebrandtia sp. TaxID=2023065 RepID=UPI002D74E883|nr:maleylpyruvate isomerase family mycothiol-dependent enzyme [Stackebrandtia sp.]HZE39291.1 maleylpyruvate isomerase family mycothiol-dependent enzyme [Stackebrandtia sp.]